MASRVKKLNCTCNYNSDIGDLLKILLVETSQVSEPCLF